DAVGAFAIPADGLLAIGALAPELGAQLADFARRRGLGLSALALEAVPPAWLREVTPQLVVIAAGAGSDGAAATRFIASMKRDAILQSIPVLVWAPEQAVADWLGAGADDVLAEERSASEVRARLSAALRRSQRDLQANPSTRLPGGEAISAAIAEREPFAACYADLDHFKEFNDRYGYAEGDDVIRAVGRLLVQSVYAHAPDRGFVGHIGGDDFLFLVPVDRAPVICEAAVREADRLLPERYSAQDRQAGYFFGKDRRGRLDRVPLMTLSIGVVTTDRRSFVHPAQVSELATEMKTYAKTLPGSVWVADRRSDVTASPSSQPMREEMSP
ncbi:MAG: diguanylate cyclase, partial [Gemmatimonadaceae bacterium]|nr:diguanylate cyclase [Gemmatimonadaceae bacterium]